MKRYLYIYGELNGGGAERVLLDILNNIDYHQNKVDLLQVNGGGLLIDEVPRDVNVIEAWHGYPLSYRIALNLSAKLGVHCLLKRGLRKTLAGRHYDVAISFLEGMPMKAHSFIMDSAERNYSWVHTDLDRYRYESSLFKNTDEIDVYNRMTAIVCVSYDAAEAFARRFPGCTSPRNVLYNPIDSEKIKRMSVETDFHTDCFTITVCGRLTEQKGLDRVIRLARKMKDVGMDAIIQIVGDGPLSERLKHQAENLSVKDKVRFIGFCRNPFPYIKASDALLCTSVVEGFSLVICEAMVLGVPVVSTKTAGPVEILDNDKYGLLCDHDDDSIFVAVKKMYDNPDLRKYYGSVGKERVKLFSVENAIKQIEEL